MTLLHLAQLAAATLPLVVANIFGGIADLLESSQPVKAAGVQNSAAQSNADAIQAATGVANAPITQAAADAGAGATQAAATGASNVTGTAATGGSNVTAAAGTANANLNPYATAGSTAAGQLQQVAANGNQQPTLDQLQISPAYQFQLQQGLDALNRSAAAQGGAISGGNVKSTQAYAQGMAGTAYQNAFQDFETAQQNNVANLQGIANSGQVASTTQGNNTMNAAQYGATTANTAATTAAGLDTNAAQYAGTLNTTAATNTGANTINGANNAAQYRQLGANDTAAGIIGKSKLITGGVDAIGSGITDAALGYATGGFAAPAAAPATNLFADDGSSLAVQGSQAARGVL